MDLSIIVPIYNTPAEALKRCFASVSGLDPAISREVLLIDDGSKAETGDFCREYAANHPDFRYLRQENSGVSAARNTGIANACGTYLTFLDSDDMLLPQVLNPALLKAGWELVLFDMHLRTNGSETLWSALDQDAGAVSREAVLRQLITTKSLNSPCAKLFLNRQLPQLRFDTDFITGEDWLFVCEYAHSCEKIFYEKAPVYCYDRDSLTATGRLAKDPDRMIRNLIAMFRKKLDMTTQNQLSDDLKSIAAADLSETLFNTAADLLLLKLLSKDRKKLLQQTVREAKVLFDGVARKTRIKTAVLLHLPWLLRPMALLRRCYLKHK